MPNRVVLRTALIVLALALAVTGCRRATPIAAPPADTAPSFAATVADQSYAVGAAIQRLTLPEASGGNGALRYTLGPELPPGLSFDAAARTLTGTPELEGVYEMTYRVDDSDDNTSEADSATLEFTITVGPETLVASVVSAVRSGAAEGALAFASLPPPGAGPAVTEVVGNQVIANGGAFFLDLVVDPGVDKLLVSIDEPDQEGFGYYEIDLPDSAGSSQRLVGHLMFDLDPALSPMCLLLTAVNQDGVAGPPVCHVDVHRPGGQRRAADHRVVGCRSAISICTSWTPTATRSTTGNRRSRAAAYSTSSPTCDDDFGGIIRNEHVAWPEQSPPPGTYVVRVNHWESCGVAETNYVVRVDYRGETSTFSGTFTGDGEGGGRGSGEVITIFTIPGAAGPPPVVKEVPPLHYRGHGDQVFVLNQEGETLDDALVTLELGDASAEVYLITTNTAHYPMDPNVERLDLLEAAAKGLRAASTEEYQPQARPPMTEPVAERPWVTEFNNNPPLPSKGSLGRRSSRRLQESEPMGTEEAGVMEGDTFAFLDRDDDRNVVEIPATARQVISDGTTTVAVWVADADWATACEPDAGDGSGRLVAAHFVPKVCVTQEMADAVGTRFLQPGAGNDIYDWVTAIFGDPWGPHGAPILIPAEAGSEIHILLFDIEGDGVPEPGESRIVGFFWAKDNFIRDPEHPTFALSNERLMFYLDAPILTVAEGETWEVTDRAPSIMIGTLAHEFQHMIHFYQKPVSRDASSEAWLNEMSSEVAEDLIADKIEGAGPRSVAFDEPTAGEPGNTRGRLPGFNLYNDIQVTRWDGLLANYDINYALGAYLARNYGGAALFSAIVQSEHSGTDAIEAALNDLGHEISFGQALQNWGAAVLLSDDTSAPVPYRYNAGGWITSRTGGMEFRLGSINLHHYVYGPPRVPGRLAWEGPYLHSPEGLNERTQPPHSVAYTTLGRNSGTMRLSVSAVGDNRITAVVKE